MAILLHVLVLLSSALFFHGSLQAAKIEKNICVIVDGFSTGRALVDGIKAYGYSAVHVQSSEGLETIFGKLDEEKYIDTLVFNGSIDKIVERLSPYQVKLVIPGAESGILLADQLANRYNVYPNDIHKSVARRDKFAMTQAVKEEGLQVVDFYKSAKLADIVRWVEQINSWPIVIKPLTSAGGDNVYFCSTCDEVKKAFEKVKTSSNVFGEPNSEVLAQTFAHGQEYMVNGVVHDDVMMITDIWKVNKTEAIYEDFVNIDHRDKEYDHLASYAKGVAKALGITYGAIHLEVKYDPARGATFIECGARLMGSAELSLQTAIHGYNQLTVLLESYFNPEFFKLLAFTPPRADRKVGLTVSLISDREGKIVIDRDIGAYFKESPCFHSLYFRYKDGDILSKTVDMLTSPGDVMLVGEDKETVLRECKRIREIEKCLYRDLIIPN